MARVLFFQMTTQTNRSPCEWSKVKVLLSYGHQIFWDGCAFTQDRPDGSDPVYTYVFFGFSPAIARLGSIYRQYFSQCSSYIHLSSSRYSHLFYPGHCSVHCSGLDHLKCLPRGIYYRVVLSLILRLLAQCEGRTILMIRFWCEVFGQAKWPQRHVMQTSSSQYFC